IQSSWVTQGPKIGQMALYYGANDMGSVMIEENVVRAAGTSYRMDEQEICRLIADIGLVPRRRNMRYQFV
ncbi:dehypoxanthine futalosine cyclase, partial [Candidatus Uhrbacteria bacterium]|nr:dehypoxanthine futalosine cyclase [Candidatus Uhrbacteria bacterium]